MEYMLYKVGSCCSALRTFKYYCCFARFVGIMLLVHKEYFYSTISDYVRVNSVFSVRYSCFIALFTLIHCYLFRPLFP